MVSDQLNAISAVVHFFPPVGVGTCSPYSHKNSHDHGENDKINKEPQHVNRAKPTSKPVDSREQKIRVIHVNSNIVAFEDGRANLYFRHVLRELDVERDLFGLGVILAPQIIQRNVDEIVGRQLKGKLTQRNVNCRHVVALQKLFYHTLVALTLNV